jgi:cytochrome P450
VLRPIVQFFIPELRDVWRCNSRAQELLAPILAKRMELEKSGDFKKPLDSIEWIRDDAQKPEDKNDPHLHAILQLILSALSVNTTTQLLTNSIFNLANWPQYVPILREELQATLTEAGGEWTMDSMPKLEKLDSFIKETLRHSGHLTRKNHLFQTSAIYCDANVCSHLPTTSKSAHHSFRWYHNPQRVHRLRAYRRHQL